MFNKDFFPTPRPVIEYILSGYTLEGKTILEPSAGKGDIVDYCIGAGANVIACEKHPDLLTIVAAKCPVIAGDFLTVTSEQVSHIDMIVMNPPFSSDEKHILHAWEIAPAGCKIVALCNAETLEKTYSYSRKELKSVVDSYGNWRNIGGVFAKSERPTDVEIGLIELQKPGASYDSEFEGFFMEDDPQEEQYNGIMPYNFIRDVVNRYIAAIKLFDQQMELAVQMNNLTSGFYSSNLATSMKEGDKPITRSRYKKDLQKSAWNFIFSKMNMQKYATKGLKEDINRFVEQQQQIPFTMRNIYHMLDIVIQTHSQRMDKALEEVFDKLTQHYDENRYSVEGWKTNSHYLVNKKFILPNLFEPNYSGGLRPRYGWSNVEIIEDFQKALCYITGTKYEDCTSFWQFCTNNKISSNELHSWGFFEFRAFKKGTGHFTFNSDELWGKFNQHIARIKGYPLFEPKYK